MRAWIEVNLDHLTNNIQEIRRQVNNKEIMAIIKANAYGHGTRVIASHLNECGVTYFGVAASEEALLLRKEGIKSDILILSCTPLQEWAAVLQEEIQLTLTNMHEIEYLLNNVKHLSEKAVKVHLKIDTGMGRIGFSPQEALDAFSLLSNSEMVEVMGVYSHLSDADGETQESDEYTKNQIELFDNCVEEMIKIAPIQYVHILNSAGITRYAQHSRTHNMVRPGLLLYGISPLPHENDLKLKELMILKSCVVFEKIIEQPMGISYTRSYVAKIGERIGTIPIGYADGLFRSLSNVGKVYIKGSYYPMVGKLCMDNLMVSLQEESLLGEEVELIGPHLSIYEMADQSKTIVWEILTSMNPRLIKLYFKNKKMVAKVSLNSNEIYPQ